MDLEPHPESLAKARVASQPAQTGAGRQDPAPESSGLDADGRSPPANGPTTDPAQTLDLDSEPAVAEGGTETLAPGMAIGPVQRQFRLVSALGDRGQIWLARAVTPVLDAAEGGLEALRAIKIFLPSAGFREADHEERALRADMINLRSYLTRVKARVDLALKLNHPHIARAYGWWHGPDGWPFVEMEYLDRKSVV